MSRYQSFREFYPFYLSEHRNPTCRKLHFAGTTLVLVTYVFGPRLPAHGRCITAKTELAKLDQRTDALTAYVVEVCPDCNWHHLTRSYPMGRAAARRR